MHLHFCDLVFMANFVFVLCQPMDLIKVIITFLLPNFSFVVNSWIPLHNIMLSFYLQWVGIELRPHSYQVNAVLFVQFTSIQGTKNGNMTGISISWVLLFTLKRHNLLLQTKMILMSIWSVKKKYQQSRQNRIIKKLCVSRIPVLFKELKYWISNAFCLFSCCVLHTFKSG